eukprot:PhF_6_TR43064/c0_g1_i2/m.65773
MVSEKCSAIQLNLLYGLMGNSLLPSVSLLFIFGDRRVSWYFESKTLLMSVQTFTLGVEPVRGKRKNHSIPLRIPSIKAQNITPEIHQQKQQSKFKWVYD